MWGQCHYMPPRSSALAQCISIWLESGAGLHTIFVHLSMGFLTFLFIHTITDLQSKISAQKGLFCHRN